MFPRIVTSLKFLSELMAIRYLNSYHIDNHSSIFTPLGLVMVKYHCSFVLCSLARPWPNLAHLWSMVYLGLFVLYSLALNFAPCGLRSNILAHLFSLLWLITRFPVVYDQMSGLICTLLFGSSLTTYLGPPGSFVLYSLARLWRPSLAHLWSKIFAFVLSRREISNSSISSFFVIFLCLKMYRENIR